MKRKKKKRKRQRQQLKRRRQNRRTRRRRKTELEKTTDFVFGTSKLLVQTSAVMGIARVASDVMNR